MKFHTDGSIPEDPEIVWVFGSNLSGVHGAGAAKVAVNRFGAVWGKGNGRFGRSFAIPTKDDRIITLPLHVIGDYIRKGFVKHSWYRSDQQFFVTRIGCGLAGHKDSDIAPFFKQCWDNCSFAEEWRPYLQDK